MDLYVLAFRGTELKWDDIETNMRFTLVKTESDLMHYGFKTALDVVISRLDEFSWPIHFPL